jgi:DNA ligase-1
LACFDHGDLKEVGKVSTGLKELESEGITFKKMTEILEPLITKTKGKFVELKPDVVIEVGYEEIQKSVNYNSGYALRFPRFLRLRLDEKKTKDINSIEDLEKLFIQQRGRDK